MASTNVRKVIIDHLGRVDTLKRDGKTGGKGKTAAQNRSISRAAAELDERLHLVDFEVVSQIVEAGEKGDQAVDIAKELTTVIAKIEKLESFKGRIAQKKKPEITRLSSRHASLLAAQFYFDAIKSEPGAAPNGKINTFLKRTQGYNMDFESWADSKTFSSLLEWMPEHRQFGMPEDEPTWGNSRDGMVESAAATKSQAIAQSQKAYVTKGKRKPSSPSADRRNGEETAATPLDQLLSTDRDKALHEYFGNEESFGTGAFMVTGPDGMKAADGGEYATSMENFPGWLEAQVSRHDKATEAARIAETKERSELKALKNTWSPLPSDAGLVRHNVTNHFDMSNHSPDASRLSRLSHTHDNGGADERQSTTAFLPSPPATTSSQPRPFGDQPEHLTPSLTSAERGMPLPSPPSNSVSAPSNASFNATMPTVSPMAASLISSIVHGIEMTTAATTLVSLCDQGSGSVAQEQDLAERVRALPRRVGKNFARNADVASAEETLEIESNSSQESPGEEAQDMDWEAS
ncbi:hypothetical protein KC361_g3116 [Hortaea werneckii]|nr:hypothetical protein KC361_g3116 [Hortaea werneckii]KAI7512756.1 hypothetical protein KC347_g2244 [Hortaea werneckii]